MTSNHFNESSLLHKIKLLKLDKKTEMPQMAFNIDVVSSCNLRCPSCPVGSIKDVQNAKGIMSPNLLEKILRKASQEMKIVYVGLFNWTEPLIHPKLAELVKITQQYAPCYLSSNLNLAKANFREIFSSNPAYFRITVSGFTQKIYSKGHRNGNIEIVKDNMKKIAKIKQELNSKTTIDVHYLRYNYNLQEEIFMKFFSESLGFSFTPIWAGFGTVEQALSYENNSSSFLEKLDSETLEILNSILFFVGEKTIQDKLEKLKNLPCFLRENQITLNALGEVMLCCGIFDEKIAKISSSFLEESLSVIQDKKRKNILCSRCMNIGVHQLHPFTHTKEFNLMAMQKVLKIFEKLV